MAIRSSRAHDLGEVGHVWHGESSRLTEVCRHLLAQVNRPLLIDGLGVYSRTFTWSKGGRLSDLSSIEGGGK